MDGSMESGARPIQDSPEKRSIGRILLDSAAEAVLNSVLFCFKFFGWTVKWTFATIFFIGVMGLAGYFVFTEAVEGGGYISLIKIAPPLLVLMLWARLLTWIYKDAPAAHLPRIGLNFSFLSGMAEAYA